MLLSAVARADPRGRGGSQRGSIDPDPLESSGREMGSHGGFTWNPWASSSFSAMQSLVLRSGGHLKVSSQTTQRPAWVSPAAESPPRPPGDAPPSELLGLPKGDPERPKA